MKPGAAKAGHSLDARRLQQALVERALEILEPAQAPGNYILGSRYGSSVDSHGRGCAPCSGA